MVRATRLAGVGVALGVGFAGLLAAQERRAFFGDLHVHTRYSFDAFITGTRADPDDAYRYARGEAIPHPAGFDIQLDRPLDFTAVTDHANYLGMLDAMADPDHPLHELPEAPVFLEARTPNERFLAFRGSSYIGEHLDHDVIRSAWQRTIESAERNYEPGVLTTFVGYEYTSSFGGNLHRNVIFRGRAAPGIPFSRLDSVNPEKLWEWIDGLREQGIEALAIPHNSNSSDGHMFALETFDGEPFDAAYAERMDAVTRAYAEGVPMGGDLRARGAGSPRFLVTAMKDPLGTDLQRVQVVKGWISDGDAAERVYDVRALENPTCRWSTWDAVRAGTTPRPDLPATIQERAWSSPIWLLPAE